MDFSSRLKTCLDYRNISASDLSVLTGISSTTLSRYLNEKKLPSGEHVKIIAATLEVSSDYLLGINNTINTHGFSGFEYLFFDNKPIACTLMDFWSFGFSDLIMNTTRGIFAEFLVASSLYPDKNIRPLQKTWSPYDILSPSGRRIEVKSSAYIQSWTNDSFSAISFDIAPRKYTDPILGSSPVFKRPSDLYVFSVYTAKNNTTTPLDLSYWWFYVLPTCVLNAHAPNQKKIRLSSLLKLNPIKIQFPTLAKTIETISIEDIKNETP